MTENTFNPEVFLNTTTNEANSTEMLAVPEGEYVAVSSPVTAESFSSYDIKNGDRAGQKGYSLNVEWTINDDNGALKEYLGRAPKVRQNIMLDLSGDGALEFGKGRNVGLGQLREALNQNATGRPWQFSQLGGQVAKIKVKHTLDTKNGKTYVNVVNVAKL